MLGWVKDENPDYDWFFCTFRATHPRSASASGFANDYRPWETGGKLVYGDACKPAR